MPEPLQLPIPFGDGDEDPWYLTPEERQFEAAVFKENMRQYAQAERAREQAANAPSPAPTVSQDELSRMSLAGKADYLHAIGLASLNRYGGRPDLLMKEHPHRDFRTPVERERLRAWGEQLDELHLAERHLRAGSD